MKIAQVGMIQQGHSESILKYFNDHICKLSVESSSSVDEMTLIKTLQVMIMFLNANEIKNPSDAFIKSIIESCFYLHQSKIPSIKSTVTVTLSQFVRFIDETKNVDSVKTSLAMLN